MNIFQRANIDQLSKAVQNEIARISMEMETIIMNQSFKVHLSDTDRGAGRRPVIMPDSTLKYDGLQLLDGKLDGHFSIDVKVDHSREGAGVRSPARLLCQYKEEKGTVKYVEVVGVVDTHGTQNVKPWHEVVRNNQQQSYLMVKNVRNEMYGVKKINTNGNVGNNFREHNRGRRHT